jgi:D-glycero-D-manno-heptose 1,7-bisphosphate phosphatase
MNVLSLRASPDITSSIRRTVFLDKDGTLLENVPYNIDSKRMQFTQGAVAGLQLLHAANYALIVITNQSGVARGYFSEAALTELEQHLYKQLEEVGVSLAGFYYCPHHPDGVVAPYNINCACRKPQPGLLYKAAMEHNIDLSQSWFIGDILHDVEAGRAAGCRTILINNGNETEWNLSLKRLPHHVVIDLQEAAKIILALDYAIDFNTHPPAYPAMEAIHEF